MTKKGNSNKPRYLRMETSQYKCKINIYNNRKQNNIRLRKSRLTRNYFALRYRATITLNNV